MCRKICSENSVQVLTAPRNICHFRCRAPFDNFPFLRPSSCIIFKSSNVFYVKYIGDHLTRSYPLTQWIQFVSEFVLHSYTNVFRNYLCNIDANWKHLIKDPSLKIQKHENNYASSSKIIYPNFCWKYVTLYEKKISATTKYRVWREITYKEYNGPKLYGSIITQKPKMVLSPRSFIFKPNTMQAIEIKMALWANFPLESAGDTESFSKF